MNTFAIAMIPAAIAFVGDILLCAGMFALLVLIAMRILNRA